MSEDLRPYGNPGSDDFRLEAYPFYLLNRAVSRYNHVIETELRKLPIDIPTWRVLMILGEQQPLAIGHVAKSAVINISTMMRIVERMAKADLIKIRASEHDGRVKELFLTERGSEVLGQARIITAPLYDDLIKGFSADEFSALLQMLTRLYKNLDKD